MVRGRRTKVATPTKLERGEKLREAILSLPSNLMADGYGALLKPPGPVQLIADPVEDPKTGGMIGHVEEPLGIYIQRVSIVDNFSQRPPFDHVTDPIYKRLIRDFIQGGMMPESKVAALGHVEQARRANSLNEEGISYSIIDGLQRLYCYCISVLLVWRGEQLVRDRVIAPESWEYFKEAVTGFGDSRAAAEQLLQRVMRYEVFYRVDLAGLLHYMVTFNTGQRRMSLPVQLEIMRRPLIQELERAGIPVWQDINMLPGMKAPKDKFNASDLVLATEAFITNNAQTTASVEAERALEVPQFLENIGDIQDVVGTLSRLTTEIHPEVMRVYAEDPSRRFLLSGSGAFLVSLAAACGYIRNRNNMKMLDGALDKLRKEIGKPKEDPLNLEDYWKALAMITTSRGKATRRLVYDTFVRFFTGASLELEWVDTARQITGVAV